MSKITKQELIKLQKSLVTDEAIGEKFGITRQAIHQMRNPTKPECSKTN